MRDFTIDTLPNLDESVMNALEFFENTPPPTLTLPPFKRPLVVGSGNAIVTGKILFANADAAFADESSYQAALDRAAIDGAVIISASGGKSSVAIAKYLSEKGVSVFLVTNTANSPASAFTKETVVFPKIKEPYTYNISTYLGMLLAAKGESASAIRQHIETVVAPALSNDLSRFDSLFFVVPSEFDTAREMLVTKCDELFGSKVSGRAYTPEQTWHSKTVIPSPTELFIHFGDVERFGGPDNQLDIPLPNNAGYAAFVAIAYFVIGRIQSARPPYFKENLAAHVQRSSAHYGQTIGPIVE